MSQLQQVLDLSTEASNVLAQTFTDLGVTERPDGTATVAQPSVSQDLSKPEREYSRPDSVDMINNWGKRTILKPVQASEIDTTQKGLSLIQIVHMEVLRGGYSSYKWRSPVNG